MIAPQSLTIGGNRIAYRTCGSGPDVLMIHGWVSSGMIWQGLMSQLAPHCRTWALDLMGFGASSNGDPARALSLDDQVQHVVAFCEAQHIQPYAIIGHSMGGSVSLKLALDYPDLLKRLVVIAPVVSGRLPFNIHRLLGSPIGQTAMTLQHVIWPTATLLAPIGYFSAPFLESEVVQRGIEDFKRATWGATYGGLQSLLSLRLDQRLHEIAIPTLIMVGTHDLTVPPSESRLAASLIPNALLLEMPKRHHSVLDEDAEFVRSHIHDFLDLAANVV